MYLFKFLFFSFIIIIGSNAVAIKIVFLSNYLFGKLIPLNVIHESFICWQVAIFSNKLLLPSQ